MTPAEGLAIIELVLRTLGPSFSELFGVDVDDLAKLKSLQKSIRADAAALRAMDNNRAAVLKVLQEMGIKPSDLPTIPTSPA